MTAEQLKAAIRAELLRKDAFTSNGAYNAVQALDILIDEFAGGGGGGTTPGIDDVLAVGQMVNGVDRVCTIINDGEVSFIGMETAEDVMKAELNIHGGDNPRVEIKLRDIEDKSFGIHGWTTGLFEIFDRRTIPVGIKYEADYSAGFTDRSLIDKGWYLNFDDDRTIDLNGKFLKIQQDENDSLVLDPTGNYFKSFHDTGGGNDAYLFTYADATDGEFVIQTTFNGSAKEAKINGTVNVTDAFLTYTADKNTFSGDIVISGLAGGGTTGLSIDNDGKIIRTP